MTFFEKLERLCLRKGKSPRAVALLLGMDASAPAQWKKRNSVPSPDKAKALADYFEIPVEDLLDDSRALGSISYSQSEPEAFFAEETTTADAPGRHVAAFLATMPPGTKVSALTKEQRSQMMQAALRDYAEQNPEVIKSFAEGIDHLYGQFAETIAAMQRRIQEMEQQLKAAHSSIAAAQKLEELKAQATGKVRKQA